MKLENTDKVLNCLLRLIFYSFIGVALAVLYVVLPAISNHYVSSDPLWLVALLVVLIALNWWAKRVTEQLSDLSSAS